MASAPVAVGGLLTFVVAFARLLVLVRLDQVGGVEKGALFSADVEEGSLDAGEDGLDLTEVNVPHHAAGVGTIDQQFNKAVVLENGHAGLPRVAGDQNLALQSKNPRSRRRNSRAGS